MLVIVSELSRTLLQSQYCPVNKKKVAKSCNTINHTVVEEISPLSIDICIKAKIDYNRIVQSQKNLDVLAKMKKSDNDKIIADLLVMCPLMRTHNRNGETFTAYECQYFYKKKQYQMRNKIKNK